MSKSLFDLYDESLADKAALYENPVVDNLAEVPAVEEPYEFYDAFEGELSGRGQPEAPSREKAVDQMALSLAQKALQRKESSKLFQDKAAALNKGNGTGSY